MKKHVLLSALCGITALGIVATGATAAGMYDRDCNCGRQVERQSAPRRVVRQVRRPTYDNRGHQTNWMQSQGFTNCSQVRRSCYRGASKPGHGQAYGGVCEDRFRTCLQTGSWHTTNTGSVSGLARR